MSNAYINLTTLLSARGYDKGMYFTHEECSSLFSLINARDSRIAELESLVEQLIWVGNDLLVSNTNPVTITLFNGLVCNAKEREK